MDYKWSGCWHLLALDISMANLSYIRGWKRNLESWITAKKSEKKVKEWWITSSCRLPIMNHGQKINESWIMKKFYKWIMNHWSKNIWQSRIIILKRFRFHPRLYGNVFRYMCSRYVQFSTVMRCGTPNHSNYGTTFTFTCFFLFSFWVFCDREVMIVYN